MRLAVGWHCTATATGRCDPPVHCTVHRTRSNDVYTSTTVTVSSTWIRLPAVEATLVTSYRSRIVAVVILIRRLLGKVLMLATARHRESCRLRVAFL